MKFSLFKNCWDTSPRTLSLEEFKQLITESGPAPYKLIRDTYQLYTQAQDEEQKKELKDKCTQLKKQLPAVAPSGVFINGHAESDFQSHSGLICCDFDHYGEDTKELLSKDDHTLLAFISPTGNGVKVFVKFEGITKDNHNKAWETVYSYYKTKYGLEMDIKCKDVNRLCFLSYDSNPYFNLLSNPFNLSVYYSDTEYTEYTGDTDTQNTQLAVYSVSEAKKMSLEEVLAKCIPVEATRNKEILKLGRWLKFNSNLEANEATFRDITIRWMAHWEGVSNTGFQENLSDLKYAYAKAKTPLGQSAVDVAWQSILNGKCAIRIPQIEESDTVLHKLASLCYALGKANKGFYLGCRDAGRVLGIDYNRANKLLGILERDLKIISCTIRGTSAGRKASEYQWIYEEGS